jgi:hypothetical protein
VYKSPPEWNSLAGEQQKAQTLDFQKFGLSAGDRTII